MKGIYVILGVVLVIIVLIAAILFGFIPGLNLASVLGDNPPGSEKCDYTELEILSMLEVLTGKNLNNEAGIGFIRALNMKACGSNTKTTTDIVSHYKVEYVDWNLIDESTYSGSGWDAYSVTWTNDPTAPTLAKVILTGGGVTVKETYGYNTMTITSDGTYVTYQAFVLWLLSS